MRIIRRIFRIILLLVFILVIVLAALQVFSTPILAILPVSFASYVTTINNFSSAYISYVYLGLIVLIVYYFLRISFHIYHKEMVDIYDPKTRVPRVECEHVEKVLYTKVEKAEFQIEPKSKITEWPAKPTKEETELKQVNNPLFTHTEEKILKEQVNIVKKELEVVPPQPKTKKEKKKGKKEEEVISQITTSPTEPITKVETQLEVKQVIIEPQPIVTPVAVVQPQPVVTPVAVVQPQPVVTPVAVVQPQPVVTPVAVVQPQPVVTPVAVVQPQPVVTPVAVVQPQPVVTPIVVEEKPHVVEAPKVLLGLNVVPTVDFEVYPGLVVKISAGWEPILKAEKSKPYYAELMNFVKSEYEHKKVYPAKEDIFKCFELTDISNVRVVILGKIPFYRRDQADGLAFSTKLGVEPNPTSTIIIKEAVEDVGINMVEHGSLLNWAKQGVLLLNSVMTAPSDRPASHAECGWMDFTNAIINHINQDEHPNSIVLWGEQGSRFENLFTCDKCLVLKAPNPSPLSAANGFYGSKPFSKINNFLTSKGFKAIDWKL